MNPSRAGQVDGKIRHKHIGKGAHAANLFHYKPAPSKHQTPQSWIARTFQTAAESTTWSFSAQLNGETSAAELQGACMTFLVLMKLFK